VEILTGYLVLGGFAGILAGLLGVGGGLIIVPALVALWQADDLGGAHIMQLAIGTSLATIVFTSISSVRAHHLRGAVLWPVFWRLTPGVVIGAWLGAALAAHLPGAALKGVFGVFELLVALQMGFGWRTSAHRDLPDSAGMGLAGGLIGVVSSIIGIGGGTLTVPFLTWCNVTIQRAVGTSAACGLPIAVGGALGYMVMGWEASGLPSWSAGFVYLPALLGIAATSILFAPLGAALAHRLSTQLLRRIFAGFLALLGLWMLTTHLAA
jgi:uncharacterized membrane protein YfcA